MTLLDRGTRFAYMRHVRCFWGQRVDTVLRTSRRNRIAALVTVALCFLGVPGIVRGGGAATVYLEKNGGSPPPDYASAGKTAVTLGSWKAANSTASASNLTAFTVVQVGTLASSGFANVKLYSGATGPTTQLGATILAPVSTTFSFSGFTQASQTQGYVKLWLVSDIAAGATAGNTIQLQATVATFTSGTVPAGNFPAKAGIDTGPFANWTTTVVASGFHLVTEVENPPDVPLIPGNKRVRLGTFRTYADSGAATVTSLRFTNGGSLAAATDLSNVRLYSDTDAGPEDGATLIGTASFSGSTVTFSGLSLSVGTTATYLHVQADVSSSATVGNTLTLQFAAAGDVTLSAGTNAVYASSSTTWCRTSAVAIFKTVKQAGGGDYTTIQAAVNAIPASPVSPWVIEVQDSATYNEQVLISGKTTTAANRIWLRAGIGASPVINPNSAAATYVIQVSSVPYTTVSGFGITGLTSSSAIGGVLVTGSAQCTVEGCDVYNNLGGIFFQTSSTDGTIRNCTARSITGGGFIWDGYQVTASSHRARVYGCVSYLDGSDSRHGLFVDTATDVVVRNCIFYNKATAGTHYGTLVQGGSSPGFSGDFDLLYSSNNGGISYYGFWVWQSEGSGLNSSTTAAWAQTSGDEYHTFGAGLVPSFVSGSAGNFHLQSTAGHWASSGWTTDGADSTGSISKQISGTPNADINSSSPTHAGDYLRAPFNYYFRQQASNGVASLPAGGLGPEIGAYGNHPEASLAGGGYGGSKSWTGSSGTAWATAANWNPSGAPGAGDTVYIPSAANLPVLAGSTTVKGIVIDAGSLTISSAGVTLTVAGNFEYQLIRPGATTRTVIGNATVASGSLIISAGGLTLDGDLQTLPTSPGALNLTGGTVTFNGPLTELIDLAAAESFYHLTLASASQAVAPMGSVAVKGDLTVARLFSFPSAGTLSFTGSGDQAFTQNIAGVSIQNLTINKSSATTVTMGGTNPGLTVSNTLTVTIGTLAMSTPNSLAAVTINGGTLKAISGTTTETGLLTLSSGTFENDGGTTNLNGAITFSGGTLWENGATITIPGAVSVGGTFRVSAGTVNLNYSADVPLVVTSTGKLQADGTGTLTTTNGTNTLAIRLDGTADVNGLRLSKLGNYAGPPAVEGMTLTSGATITYLNDITLNSPYAYGVFLNRTAAESITMRGCTFNSNKPGSNYNVKVASGSVTVTMENGGGVGGQQDSTAGNNIGGEENDSDPGDSSATSDTSQGNIQWQYFDWKWVGGFGTNLWNDAGAGTNPDGTQRNWNYQGSNPTPPAYPNASTEDVWIQGANPCNQNGSFTVRNVSASSGSTFNQSGAAVTLSIWGTAFKSSGGTFSSGPDEDWVEFRGSASQTVLIIGGGATMRNLRVNKTAGTASLGTTMTVANALEVTGGTLDLSNYGLTVNGTLTLSTTLLSGGTSSLTQNGAATISGSYQMSGTSSGQFGGVAHTITGTVELNGSPTLSIANGGTFNFNAGSTFRALGTTPSVTVQGARTTGFAWNLNSGSTIDISQMNFSFANGSGFNIGSAVTISLMQSVAFTSALVGGRHLSFGGAYTFNLSGCSFDASFLPGGYNVWSSATSSGTVTVSQFTGAGQGETYDFDNPESGGAMVVTWARSLTWRGNWKYRQQVTVSNTSGSTLNAGSWVSVQFNDSTTSPGFQFYGSYADGHDVRIVYENGSSSQEVSRVIYNLSGTTGWGSTTCNVEFQTVANIATGTSDAKYYLYYGTGSDPGAPPLPTAPAGAEGIDDVSGIILFRDDFEGASLDAAKWTVGTATDEVVGLDTGPGGSGYSGSQMAKIRYTGTNGMNFYSRNIVTTGLTNVTWKYARATPSTSNLGGAGTYAPAYSVDGGVIYTDAESLSSGATATAWATTTVSNIASSGNITNFRTKFTLTNGNTGQQAYADLTRVYSFFQTLNSASIVVALNAAQENIQNKWSAAMNWTPVSVPGANDDAVIDYNTTSFSFEPTLDVAGTCLSLILKSTGGTAATDAFNSTGQTLDVGLGGFTMSGGSVNWTTSSVVTCKGGVSITTTASPGFAPAIAGNTFKVIGDPALQTITMGGAAGNTFGALQVYTDAGAAAKTVRLLSNAKTGTAKIGFGGGTNTADTTLDLNGYTLTVTSTGDTAPRPVQVVGSSATARGFLLMNKAASLVDDAGGLDLNDRGVITMSAGEIRVAKSWNETATANFIPTGGTVTFQGTAAQSITSLLTNSFYNLQVGLGANAPTLSLANDITCNDIDVVEGTFAPGAGRTVTKTGASTSDIQSGGTLQLANGTTLKLADLATLNVNSGGTLVTTATSASSRATIQNNGSGSYGVTLSGIADITYLTWKNVNTSGVQVMNGANLVGAGTNNWTGVSFEGPVAAGVYFNFSQSGSATVLPSTMSLCQFAGDNTTHANNVVGDSDGANGYHPQFTFQNFAIDSSFGAADGPPNEKSNTDPQDKILWGSAAAVVLRRAGADLSTYASLTDALKAATTAGDIVEVRDNVVRTESIDLTNAAFTNKVVIIDGAVLKSTGATFAIKGTGVLTNEIVRNLVLVRDAGGATELLTDVGRIYHCTVLGDYAVARPLVKLASGSSKMQNSIVGDGASADWSLGGTPLSGAIATRNCFLGGSAPAGSKPSFEFFDPSKSAYDVHLKAGSPCVDAASATDDAVDTDFDRGSDAETNGGSAFNLRRPIDDPATADTGTPAGIYDIGADEFGALKVRSNGSDWNQSVPMWTYPATPATRDSYSKISANFTPNALFVGENVNTTDASRDIKIIALGFDSSLILSKNVAGGVSPLADTVRKIISILSVSTSATTADLYCVVDTNADADKNGDALLGLTYNGASFTVKWAVQAIAGATRMGDLVIGNDTNLYVVAEVAAGRQLFRFAQATGAPVSGTGWAADGHCTLAAYQNIFDVDGALFASRNDGFLYAPIFGDTTNEIIRLKLLDGTLGQQQDCGATQKNHTGFNIVGGSLLATAFQDNFVWLLAQDDIRYVWTTVSAPKPANKSVDLGSGTTTRAISLRVSDGHVRVGAGNKMFKLRKGTGPLYTDVDAGKLCADSDASGDDWGPGRLFRGNLTTTPVLLGSLGKTWASADGNPQGTRRAVKAVFGTDQGCVYIVSYIRQTATTPGDEFNNDEQRVSDPAATGQAAIDRRAYDGRCYPGFPYRIPGVSIQSIVVAQHPTALRNQVIFILSNGSVIAFLEPY